MKTYMKYIGIVVLLILEILSVSKFSDFGLENIFALWGGLFFILFYRQFVNFDRSPSVHQTPGVHDIAGGSASGVLKHSTHLRFGTKKHGKMKKHSGAAFKNLSLKLIYLTLTLAHIGICYYLIKFPS
ncbi:MAG: hypothetical protein JEZ08_02125 [Clostridiales bacterium]|nr:hypothetical protein [Clostridiales bacterium]